MIQGAGTAKACGALRGLSDAGSTRPGPAQHQATRGRPPPLLRNQPCQGETPSSGQHWLLHPAQARHCHSGAPIVQTDQGDFLGASLGFRKAVRCKTVTQKHSRGTKNP